MILLVIPILVALILIRARWMLYHLDCYTLKALYYSFRTSQPPEVIHEMAQIWPGDYMLFEIWSWNFRRYIVYQDHYDEMGEFVTKELERDDIGVEKFTEATKLHDHNDDHKGS